MTVKELKERLNDYDENLRVIIPGYEGGYDDIGALSYEKINANSNWKDGKKEAWYYGSHRKPNYEEEVTEIAVLME